MPDSVHSLWCYLNLDCQQYFAITCHEKRIYKPLKSILLKHKNLSMLTKIQSVNMALTMTNGHAMRFVIFFLMYVKGVFILEEQTNSQFLPTFNSTLFNATCEELITARTTTVHWKHIPLSVVNWCFKHIKVAKIQYLMDKKHSTEPKYKSPCLILIIPYDAVLEHSQCSFQNLKLKPVTFAKVSIF